MTTSKVNQMSKLTTILHRIDLFGVNYSFLVNERDQMTTNCGIILTIIYLITIVSLFLGFGMDLYQRKKPRATFNSSKEPHRVVNFSNHNFTYAYRIENQLGSIIKNESIVTIKASHFYQEIVDGKWQIKEINMMHNRNCQELGFSKEKENYYNTSLKNWYCIDFNELKLGGYWNGNFVNGIIINALQCQNSSENNFSCSSSEEIEKFFENNITSSNLFYSDLSIEALPTLDQYENPIKSSLINRYEMLSPKITKRKIITLKTTNINSDNGWFWTSINNDFLISVDGLFSDFTLKDPTNQNILFTTFIYLDNKHETYNRSYTKIQEVIAAVGGFIKIFYISMVFIFKFISKIYKNLYLIQNIKFNEDKINKYLKEQESEKNNQSSLQTINLNFNNIKTGTVNIDSIKLQLNKKINLVNKKISLNEYLCHIFCKARKLNIRTKETFKKYNYYNNYFNKNLNILNYFELIKDVDLLKKMVLNKHQLKLLKLIHPKLKLYEPAKSENDLVSILFEYFNFLKHDKSFSTSQNVRHNNYTVNERVYSTEEEKNERRKVLDLFDDEIQRMVLKYIS
jgi:hypothetical protein